MLLLTKNNCWLFKTNVALSLCQVKWCMPKCLHLYMYEDESAHFTFSSTLTQIYALEQEIMCVWHQNRFESNWWLAMFLYIQMPRKKICNVLMAITIRWWSWSIWTRKKNINLIWNQSTNITSNLYPMSAVTFKPHNVCTFQMCICS